MANPHKGDVEFEAAERGYKLRLSANAIIELEDLLDKGVAEISALLSDAEALRMKNVRAVLWAALTDHHPGVSLKDAGEIIDAIGLVRVVELVGLAFARAFPAPDEDDVRPPTPGQDSGTGSAFSTSG